MGDRLDSLIEQLRTETNESRRDRIIDQMCYLRSDSIEETNYSNLSRQSRMNNGHSYSPSSLDGSINNGHSFLWNLFIGIILFPVVFIFSILKLIFWTIYAIIKIPFTVLRMLVTFIITNIIIATLRLLIIAFLLHCLLLWYFNRGYTLTDVFKLLNIASGRGHGVQYDNFHKYNDHNQYNDHLRF